MTWAEQTLNDWMRDQENYEASLPICDRCGDPIDLDDKCYNLPDVGYVHEDCALEWLEQFRVDPETLID